MSLDCRSNEELTPNASFIPLESIKTNEKLMDNFASPELRIRNKLNNLDFTAFGKLDRVKQKGEQLAVAGSDFQKAYFGAFIWHLHGYGNYIKHHTGKDLSVQERAGTYVEAFLCLCQLQWYREAKILFSLPLEVEEGVPFPLFQQLRVWGRYEEARQLCEGLLDNLDNETDLLCLSELGYIYKESGQIRKALNYCKRLLSLAKKMDNPLWQARGEGNIAILHGMLGDYAKAESGLRETLHLSESLPESEEKFQIINTAYLHLGNVYGYQQQIDLALFEGYLQWATDTNNPFYQAMALRNLGEAYRRLGNLDRALDYTKQSLELSDRIDDESGSIFSLGNLGSIYGQRKEFDEASRAFERQKEKADKIGDRAGFAHAIIGLGEVYSLTGQDDLAYQYIRQAVILAREIGERQIEVESLMILAEFEQKTGDLDSSLECWQQALSIAGELNNPSLQENCDRNIQRLATPD